MSVSARVDALATRACGHLYAGQSVQGYERLVEARALAADDPDTADEWLYSLIFLQGVASLRRGEDDNCVLCRGESSCILPIAPAARHANPSGSRQAIAHFTEYLQQFPDDLGVRWTLNLAHMTLGEYPDRVDPRFLVRLDKFHHSEFDVGRFRDVGHLVGLERLNMAGGAIMDDFDNDGLLDLVVTTQDPTMAMAYYRNRGDGTFEDRTLKAGLGGQYGGLNCCQADYNNDGHLDIFVCRGAWLATPMRPSLLRNNGDGTFTDVTREAGLLAPMNTQSPRCGPITTTMASSTCSSAARPGRTSSIATRGMGRSRRSPRKAGVAGTPGMQLQGRRLDRLRQRRLPGPVPDHITAEPANCTTTTATARSPTSPSAMGIDGPDARLFVLGLRFRQRRLARHLRDVL